MRDFPVCYASGLLHMLRILETLLFECPLDILSDAAALSGSSPCSFDIYTNKNSSSFEELFYWRAMRDFSVCCASGLLHMLRMFGDAAVLMSSGHSHDAAALSGSSPC